MPITIQKVVLQNFKRFDYFECDFKDEINIIIGDNESGKSTILSAIDLVLSGSRSKIESLGLENLFNVKSVETFLSGLKKIEDLPELIVEVYINVTDSEVKDDPDVKGKTNLKNIDCFGLRLVCAPRYDLQKNIKAILSLDEPNFPFEFYTISFKTFSDIPYSSYGRYVRHLLIDNTQINNEYATKEYVKQVFSAHVDGVQNSHFHNTYRKLKTHFKERVLNTVNDTIEEYDFAVKNTPRANFETDLTIMEDGVYLENRGKGRQCFIKTRFALQGVKKQLDVILLEEPENHLSHTNMKLLINNIKGAENKQLFIATHSSLICSRLDLRNTILTNSSSTEVFPFEKLNSETAKFFIKAPDNNILEFILSRRVILVEGDAEYILMEYFFEKTVSLSPENSGVHIISVDGTSFKRYLDLAKMLNIKTAVIRDNDGNYQVNCQERYIGYITQDLIEVFSETNNEITTFEVAVYSANEALCKKLFTPKKNTVQDFMISNKTDVALKLLESGEEIVIPEYIKNALSWIRE